MLQLSGHPFVGQHIEVPFVNFVHVGPAAVDVSRQSESAAHVREQKPSSHDGDAPQSFTLLHKTPGALPVFFVHATTKTKSTTTASAMTRFTNDETSRPRAAHPDARLARARLRLVLVAPIPDALPHVHLVDGCLAHARSIGRIRNAGRTTCTAHAAIDFARHADGRVLPMEVHARAIDARRRAGRQLQRELLRP
jgi:hypothetical protein